MKRVVIFFKDETVKMVSSHQLQYLIKLEKHNIKTYRYVG